MVKVPPPTRPIEPCRQTVPPRCSCGGSGGALGTIMVLSFGPGSLGDTASLRGSIGLVLRRNAHDSLLPQEKARPRSNNPCEARPQPGGGRRWLGKKSPTAVATTCRAIQVPKSVQLSETWKRLHRTPGRHRPRPRSRAAGAYGVRAEHSRLTAQSLLGSA